MIRDLVQLGAYQVEDDRECKEAALKLTNNIVALREWIYWLW